MTWPTVELDAVADTALGKMLDRGRSRGWPSVPYLRNVNVQWDRIDTGDLLEMELADDDRKRFEVEPGDLLVCEGGEVGRAAIWHGPERIAYQKALHRVRSKGDLDLTFLRYVLEHRRNDGTLQRLSTGSTIAHLPQQQLRRVPVPMPPVAVQRRIVDILEDHLSRLDAAVEGVAASVRRVNGLRERLIDDAIVGRRVPGRRVATALRDVGTADGALEPLPSGWRWLRLGDVAHVVGGVTKDSKKQADPRFVEVPYLRVANVQRGSLRLDNVTTIRVSPDKAKALRLEPGDVLLNEGGDRDKLARGWVWEGQIESCIHQNHVFRARPTIDLDPYFLSFATNSFGGRWAERNGKQSVNLASISLSVVRKMPVVVPPPTVAREIAAQLQDQLAALQRLAAAAAAAQNQQAALRRAVLAAVFEGKLTGRHTDAEVIEEMASV